MAEGIDRAVYCDVDGTLAATNIVQPLIWFRRKLEAPATRYLWLASLCGRAPYWLILDRINRSASNRSIYFNYRGLNSHAAKSLADECYRQVIRPRVFPSAWERLRKFRQEGFRLVLVTGSPEFVMRPLAREIGAELLAPSLIERASVFVGGLNTAPLTGERKACAVQAHAEDNNVALAQSYALGDAWGDLPMLESVGHPIAINPDRRLATLAAQRGWPAENWKKT